MVPEIIYSDPDLVVINKPPDMAVHGGINVRGETLVDFLLEKFPEIKGVGDPSTHSTIAQGGEQSRTTSSGQVILRPGIVHRLDKDTSGVMMVARDQKSFEKLKELFQKRLVEKTYWAIVCGKPKEKSGLISLPIGRLVKNPLKRGVETKKSKIRGAREAVTEYKVLKSGGEYSLVELKPKTGRMHQLRVHMKALGYPVACDKVYGGKNVCCPAGTNRQLLHAKSLSFSFPAFADLPASKAGATTGEPAGRKLHFEADPPEDFLKATGVL